MGQVSATGWPIVAGAILIWALAVTVAVVSMRRRPRVFTARLAVWTIVGMVGCTMVLHAGGDVPTDIPRWFYAIALLPFVGAALALVGWAHLRWAGRILAIGCVPLGLLASLLIANQHYAYWPTVNALLGKDHADPMLDPGVVLGLRSTSVAAAQPVALDRPQPRSTAHGYLVDLPIPGPASGFHARDARVWLPPSFVDHPDLPRPVIEFIGGTPSWPSDWTRAAGLDVLADSIAAKSGGEAPIMVMVDANAAPFGDTECVDGTRGNAETYLVTDVPAFMHEHFAASNDASRWGIVGYSEGGTCALTLALRYPDRFHSFVDLAGDGGPNTGSHSHTVKALFGGSEDRWRRHDPTTILTSTSYDQLAGWFGSGADDATSKRCSHRLVAASRRAGLVTEEHVVPGGHDFTFVHTALGDALPWISSRLEAST
jgi:enterochelin esterase-like enzyme